MTSPDRRQILAGLICAVHDQDHPEIDRLLDGLTDGQMRRLLLNLAGLLDPSKPLGNLIPADSYAGTIGRIVGIVERHTWVEGHEIYERNQFRDVARARQIVCWVATQCGLTSVKIGRTLDRDHATVLHAVKRVNGDPKMLRMAQKVLDELFQQRNEVAA